MDDDYLPVNQVAKLKGISRNAVYKAVSEGRLASVRIVGIAIKRADAELWVPKSRVGRRVGKPTSEEAKAKISEAQKARWQKRKQEVN